MLKFSNDEVRTNIVFFTAFAACIPSTASYGHNDGANVSALAMGVPDEFREGVVASFEKDIRDNGGHLNTGYSERSFSSGSFATAALPLYFSTSFIEASATVRSLCYLTPNFDFRLQIIHNEKRYFRYQSLLKVRQSISVVYKWLRHNVLRENPRHNSPRV